MNKPTNFAEAKALVRENKTASDMQNLADAHTRLELHIKKCQKVMQDIETMAAEPDNVDLEEMRALYAKACKLADPI